MDLPPCRTCTDTPWVRPNLHILPGTLGSPTCQALPGCLDALVPETCGASAAALAQGLATTSATCFQMRPDRLTEMLTILPSCQGRQCLVMPRKQKIMHIFACLGKAYKSGLAAWLAAFAADALSCWTAHPWAQTRCSTQKQDSRHVHTAAVGAICSRQIRQTLLLLSFEEMKS